MFTCFDCAFFFFISPSGSGVCSADLWNYPTDFQKPASDCCAFFTYNRLKANYPAFRPFSPALNSVSTFVEFDPFDFF